MAGSAGFLPSFFARLLGGRRARRQARYERLVDRMGRVEPSLQRLTDEALRDQASQLRKRALAGQRLEELLVEAFALAREAARRTLGMRPFDVQLLGGVALHEGLVAEMKTGEGKTLVATLPAFVNALAGRGVHIVTVNDYLAERDAEWMRPLYELLGLTVGVIFEQMGADERQELAARRAAYACDVTYGTNHEIAFDYLRDNLAISPDQIVQRGFNYAIVDEVDFLLIDEARTPLIISGPTHDDEGLCERVATVIRRLCPDTHYSVEAKTRTASLTDAGLDAIQAALGVANLADPEHIGLFHAVHQSVLAHAVYRRDVDYIVGEDEDGEPAIVIVDEFTGRLDPDKRFADGLHQALEAKERVPVRSEDRTLAKVTYQTFFCRYAKLAGMTGTAWPERRELMETYGLDVHVVPTHRPMIRRDEQDLIYASLKEKHTAVVQAIEALRSTGRPVLVGTASVEESEKISLRLRRANIDHAVLNAKSHRQEARVIAQAGRSGAVTISTNMAGRGTDIRLGGSPPVAPDDERRSAPPGTAPRHSLQQERQAVQDAGGLHVIGTSHHEAVRIDDQLRGRAGRQGDPGSSQFLVSLEDAIWQRFGKRILRDVRDSLREADHPRGEPITAPRLRRLLRDLQRKVDAENQAARRDVLQYDLVVHAQREAIYAWRGSLVNGEGLELQAMITQVVEHQASLHSEPDTLAAALGALFHEPFELPEHAGPEQVTQAARERALTLLEQRRATAGWSELQQLGRRILLEAIDELWTEHLTELERLEEGIGLRSYAEVDPVVAWRQEATGLWHVLLHTIRARFVHLWFRLETLPR